LLRKQRKNVGVHFFLPHPVYGVTAPCKVVVKLCSLSEIYLHTMPRQIWHWQRDGGGEGQLRTLNFWMCESCRKTFLLTENFRGKMQDLDLKTNILGGNFGVKSKFGAPIMSYDEEICSVCRQIVTFSFLF